MRLNRSTLFIQGLFCLVSSLVFLISGCGGSDSAGAGTFKTEAEGRYRGLRSLAEVNTKKVILEKKKAALEAKAKANSK